MCTPVVQGYGLSETCGSSFVALPAPVRSAPLLSGFQAAAWVQGCRLGLVFSIPTSPAMAVPSAQYGVPSSCLVTTKAASHAMYGLDAWLEQVLEMCHDAMAIADAQPM